MASRLRCSSASTRRPADPSYPAPRRRSSSTAAAPRCGACQPPATGARPPWWRRCTAGRRCTPGAQAGTSTSRRRAGTPRRRWPRRRCGWRTARRPGRSRTGLWRSAWLRSTPSRWRRWCSAPSPRPPEEEGQGDRVTAHAFVLLAWRAGSTILYMVNWWFLTCHVLILTPYRAFCTMMFSATTSETQARLLSFPSPPTLYQHSKERKMAW